MACPRLSWVVVTLSSAWATFNLDDFVSHEKAKTHDPCTVVNRGASSYYNQAALPRIFTHCGGHSPRLHHQVTTSYK
jgi:hypothetical protein